MRRLQTNARRPAMEDVDQASTAGRGGAGLQPDARRMNLFSRSRRSMAAIETNVIPGKMTVPGTLRTFDQAMRRDVMAKAEAARGSWRSAATPCPRGRRGRGAPGESPATTA